MYCPFRLYTPSHVQANTVKPEKGMAEYRIVSCIGQIIIGVDTAHHPVPE